MEFINEQIQIIKDNITTILLNNKYCEDDEILYEIRYGIDELNDLSYNGELENAIETITEYSCIGECNNCESNNCLDCIKALDKAVYDLEYTIDKGIFRCIKCGYYDFIENCTEYDGEYYCPDCEPNQENTLTEYHEYEIKNNTKSPYTIGIELETEYPSTINTNQVAQEIQSSFITSQDNSLKNGIEFVSQVYDLKNLNELKNDLKDLTEQIKDHEGYCHKSTRSGLHIHISKTSFTSLKNLFEFVNQNKDFFLAIGGRIIKPEAYEYCLTPTNNYINNEQVTSRYGLLNLNNKYETVEFRFFNSTLNTETLNKRLDIIKTLKEFENQNNLNKANILDYVMYVKTNNKELYQHITKMYNKRIKPIRNKILKTNNNKKKKQNDKTKKETIL